MFHEFLVLYSYDTRQNFQKSYKFNIDGVCYLFSSVKTERRECFGSKIATLVKPIITLKSEGKVDSFGRIFG